jgi:hypothetical protein
LSHARVSRTVIEVNDGTQLQIRMVQGVMNKKPVAQLDFGNVLLEWSSYEEAQAFFRCLLGQPGDAIPPRRVGGGVGLT